MATRASDMADLDQYIADNQPTTDATVQPLVDPNAPTEAVGAPTVGTDTTGAKLVPRVDEPAPIQDEDTTRASIREMERTQLEQAQQRRDESAAAQAIRQGVQGVTDNTARINTTLRQALSKVAASVGAVPIPGDLITPLSVLLIFFFALVVINGHTRLSWLWLVLSGNASITTGGGASFGQPTTTVTPPTTTTPVTGTPIVTTPVIMAFAGAGEPT